MAAVTTLLVAAVSALSPPRLVGEATSRRTSNARVAFSAAVQDPLLKDPQHSPLELVTLIAAEEHGPAMLPAHLSSRIQSGIEQIAAPAAQRLALTRRISTAVTGPNATAMAIVQSLFGTKSPDDELQSFRCVPADPFQMSEESVLPYHDARNILLDHVLDRRQGTPLMLSLIALEACNQLGVPMVGLRSPTALLLAPADGSPFVVDCFNGGRVLCDHEAANVLSVRMGPPTNAAGWACEMERLAHGRAQLAAMRAAPMTPLQWGSDVLRSLREVYEETGDAMRLLGVCDRLRVIGAHSRLAVNNAEYREMAGQLALCIYKLKWEGRRNEARALLLGVLRSSAEMGTDPTEAEKVDALLAKPFFRTQ